MSSGVTDADRALMAQALANVLVAHYGIAGSVALAGPLGVVMRTLNDMGALTSPASSVATEAEKITDEAVFVEILESHGWYEATNRCICGERPPDMTRHIASMLLTAH